MTIAPEVEQPPEDDPDGDVEEYPVYGVPDFSPFYES